MDNQLSLTQMLKALNPKDATRIGGKLKKLSKKKVFKSTNVNSEKAHRKLAYDDASKDVSKWEGIVKERRRARTLKFPVDDKPTSLEPPSSDINPVTPFEKEIDRVLSSTDATLHDKQELSKAEEKYLKAISVSEAKERHQQLQRTRSLISSYGAKMRRQKMIKSKSYHRLLKHDKIRRHVKKVESDKDLLMEEIGRLQSLRAQERATLKHKNTGKWAKHAKFRTKYDEQARQALIQQIEISQNLLAKPAPMSDDDEDTDYEEEHIEKEENEQVEETDTQSETSGTEIESDVESNNCEAIKLLKSSNNELNKSQVDKDKIVSSELIQNGQSDDDGDQEDDEQRKLMMEAFSSDDVVQEFFKEKKALADDEQPKFDSGFLPGWGKWAGPGIKTKRAKVKLERKKRHDDNLKNVIISEESVKSNPGQIILRVSKPISGTFVSQKKHRELIKPRIQVRPGARIEPLKKRNFSTNFHKPDI